MAKVSKVQHIAVVDDNKEIRDLIAQYLTRYDYRISPVDSGAALWKLWERTPPDLVILDIMMPGEDGLDVCRRVRATSDVPVIFLTAMAEDTDRIVGLELGADDYVVKPFNSRELLARVRAVLRRGRVADLPAAASGIVRFGPWQLNTLYQELTGSDGVDVALSTAEFRLLKVFVENPFVVMSRDRLLDLTSGRNAEPFDRSIDNQVSRLRKKIDLDPDKPLIKTHWGEGYSLVCKVEFE